MANVFRESDTAKAPRLYKVLPPMSRAAVFAARVKKSAMAPREIRFHESFKTFNIWWFFHGHLLRMKVREPERYLPEGARCRG